jgi:cold shock CspA family protein
VHQPLCNEGFEGFVVHDAVEDGFVAVHAVEQQGFEVLVEDRLKI